MGISAGMIVQLVRVAAVFRHAALHGRVVGPRRLEPGAEAYTTSASAAAISWPIALAPACTRIGRPCGVASDAQRAADLEVLAAVVQHVQLRRVVELPVALSCTKASGSQLSHSPVTTSTNSRARSYRVS